MRFKYPEPYKYAGGCKVCWRTYDDEETAKKAAVVARREARHMETLGYEWGYQSPGEVRAHGGKFHVTCP